MAGRAVRAAESRFPMPQFFAVTASALDCQARHAQRSTFVKKALWLAADPLRLSAEGAAPDLVTSDALCRAYGAYAEGSITFALARLTHSPFGEHAWPPPRQNEQCHCLFKATDHTPSRTPSIGSMLCLAA